MSTDQHGSSHTTERLAQHRHMLSQSWRGLSAATRRAVRIVLIFLTVAYFIFCALFLSLRYVVLPNIDLYKTQVEQMASHAVDRRVSIATIHASWRGLRPHLSLNNVVIYNKDGQPALSLPNVAATLSWWSVSAADLRLETLEITRPDLDIERDAEGNIFVAGILVDHQKEDDGKGMDWVLSQREIVIRDGWIRWNDAMREVPELVLNDVDFVLHNAWRHHRMALRATPPAAFAAPIDLRADFVHPAFSRKISDFARWKGMLYADWRNTNLAVWKTYFDYPIEVQKGEGAIRAWVNFDQSRIVDFTADLGLSNVSARLRKDLQTLNLKQVKGRISASEATGKAKNSWFSFGSKGHTLALTDFSFETNEGLKLLPTTIRHAYTPATKKQPEKTEISASLLDLKAFADVVEHLPLSSAQRKMLADFSPAGQLKGFSAEWQGAYPEIAAYKFKGEFDGLSMKAQAPRAARPKQGKIPAQAAVPGIPGFRNMSGRVDASDEGGAFTLASEDLTLQLPGYFSEPDMHFERLDMQAKWNLQDKSRIALRIDHMNFRQEGLVGSLSGSHVMPLTAERGKPLGTLDISAKISQFDIKRIARYLPLNTPPDLREWLSGAFEGGLARDVALTLKGDVDDFPFTPKSPAEKSKGMFSVAGKIENGRLNYAPGEFFGDEKWPLWPLLEEISGDFSLDRTRLQINADSAKTNGIVLSDVSAVIPDLLSDGSVLNLEGKAAGPLQNLLDYVNKSPVAEWIANFTEESKASGDAKLALKIALPLHEMTEAKVQGILQFAGNAVTLQKEMPPILQTQGELKFNESGFSLTGIKGNFLGGAIAVNGGTQKDGTTAVKINGSVSVDGLRKTYQTPTMQRLFQRIAGSTRYTAAVNIKNKQPEISIESSMQGISLDFPAPLRKSLGEALPLKFELAGLPSNDALKKHDEIRLALGTAISARYTREKSTGKGASWQVVRGGIGVNVPAPQPDSGLIANVSLKSLDIDAWRSTVAAITGPGNTTEPSVDATDLGITQYIEPDVLAARTAELHVMGKKLDNVVVGASQQKGVWQANIDSEQASGYITWAEPASGKGLGRVTARLTSLIIPQSAASNVSDLFEGKSNSLTQIPSLDIVAENFQLFGKKLGQLELLVNHAPGSNGQEWQINKLSLLNSDAAFRAKGKWERKEDDSVTHLTYALDIDDAGRLLKRFGFANVLRGGKGKLDGDISWKGLPFSIDMPTLSGQLHLDLLAGQFLKVEPGAAKLLGVLSLQSLPRRLALDFRDVFSAGFAFDGVVATAAISKGMLTTDNFKMRGVNAVVLMDGTVDIVKEAQDLHVVVIPEINAGAASVVYGLAINPVIGLGSFLAQLFLRDPLMKAFTAEYQITGPWADPAINKIPRKTGTLLNNPELPSSSNLQ